MIDTGYPAEDEDPFEGLDTADLRAELARRLHELDYTMRNYPESRVIPITGRRISALTAEIERRPD